MRFYPLVFFCFFIPLSMAQKSNDLKAFQGEGEFGESKFNRIEDIEAYLEKMSKEFLELTEKVKQLENKDFGEIKQVIKNLKENEIKNLEESVKDIQDDSLPLIENKLQKIDPEKIKTLEEKFSELEKKRVKKLEDKVAGLEATIKTLQADLLNAKKIQNQKLFNPDKKNP